MTDAVRETIAKFDHALPNIIDPDRLTSLVALDSVLLYVYVLRCHHQDRLGEKRYRAVAGQSDGGRTTEALVLVRGKATHDLSKLVAPKSSRLYPGFYPGRWTFPGESLKWRTVALRPVAAQAVVTAAVRLLIAAVSAERASVDVMDLSYTHKSFRARVSVYAILAV